VSEKEKKKGEERNCVSERVCEIGRVRVRKRERESIKRTTGDL
jgi:hypothetical protein